MNMKPVWMAVFAAALLGGLAGCEREGTLERAGEEADEAVDTLKEGEESTATKVDDAVDEAREGANETAEEMREE
jgi:hypothetical protein